MTPSRVTCVIAMIFLMVSSSFLASYPRTNDRRVLTTCKAAFRGPGGAPKGDIRQRPRHIPASDLAPVLQVPKSGGERARRFHPHPGFEQSRHAPEASGAVRRATGTILKLLATSLTPMIVHVRFIAVPLSA